MPRAVRGDVLDNAHALLRMKSATQLRRDFAGRAFTTGGTTLARQRVHAWQRRIASS
jgi:hypothetical protein